ncbi:MAG TPA: carboxyl transferase domain-containing protein, partial [Frankiaceae bacterium]|nr:carboxyl transferase domain-containing protein [Frankiaceae bacterium]
MPRTPGADWRDELLAGIALRPQEGEPVNRLGWPGYEGRTAVRWGTGRLAGEPAVVAVWDGRVYGGSFGERDATAFAAAADAAARIRLPLVSFLRSGGTRLQEGVAALVGLARATLALERLARAGVAHLAVVDAPTTGGIWVTVGSRADLRCAVAGATVGFAGPRVVAVTTGSPVPPGSHTARSAYRAGLVDALLEPGEVGSWLARALAGLHPPPDGVRPPRAVPSRTVAHDRTGMEQVRAARTVDRPSGLALLVRLVPGGTALRGPDDTVAARVGRLAASGRP